MTKTFSGEYHHSLDTKGRLIVPAKFREILGSRFWIGKGFDQCLQIYDEEDWEAFSNSLKALPKNSDKARKLVRYFMSGTVEVEIDKQGRILLPQVLRDRAGLDKDITLLGVGDHIEIWDTNTYEEKYSFDDEAALEADWEGLGV